MLNYAGEAGDGRRQRRHCGHVTAANWHNRRCQ